MTLSTRKSRLTLAAAGIALLCVIIAIIEGHLLRQAMLFNDAVRHQDWERAGTHESPNGSLARALAAQQRGAYRLALRDYTSLRDDREVELTNRAAFNTGNVYLQWAMKRMQDADHDTALPLVEMAKETYRRLLRRDHRVRPARYNLERALQLAPDPEPPTPAAHSMPERSPRALGIVRSEVELP